MQKSRFPLKKLIIFLLITLGVAGIVSAIILYMNKLVTTQPVTFEPPDEGVTVAEKERDLTADTFSLRYASTLDTLSNISGGDKTALEVYRLSSTSLDSRRTLVITVKPLSPEGFEGESSYLLRKRNPSEYAERAYSQAGLEFIVFEKTNGNEQTAFIRGSGKLAMLAYTVSVAGAEPRTELEALLDGFAWRN